MSNKNNVLVGDFQTTLIHLHNELGKIKSDYCTEAKDECYERLHSVLDRYGIGGLKGTLVFDYEEE